MGVDTAGLTTDLTTIFEDLDPAKTAAEAAASVAQAIHDNVDSAPDHTDSVAPTTSDDNTQGYVIGSRWIIPGSDEYVCLDASTGAAVWRNTTSGGGSGISGPGSTTVGHVVLWNATDGSVVKDGGALAAVATSGDYSDLSGIPSTFAPSAHQSSHRVGGSDALPTGDASTAGLLKLGALGGAQAWDTDLDAYAALTTTGLIARTGAGTVAARTLTAGSPRLSVTNGDGVSGNPTADVAATASTTAYTSAGTTSAVAAPSWATLCYFRIVGGGGGGGSGRRGPSNSLRGGAGGGAGGGYVEGWIHVSQLSGGTLDVIVGAGGGGGAAVTTNSTDGADGSTGGDSYLQTGGVKIAFAPGGPGGAKGTSSGGATGGTAVTATAQWAGGNGGGVGAAGTDATTAAAGGGGGASMSGANTYSSSGGEGGAGATSRAGTTTGASGGGGAGAGNAGSAASTPSTYQPGGGGGGGEQGNLAGSIAGGTGGAGKYGGGGGGGGGSTNGANSGAGGAGGDGFVILTWV